MVPTPKETMLGAVVVKKSVVRLLPKGDSLLNVRSLLASART